jgi:hypothetical protein
MGKHEFYFFYKMLLGIRLNICKCFLHTPTSDICIDLTTACRNQETNIA